LCVKENFFTKMKKFLFKAEMTILLLDARRRDEETREKGILASFLLNTRIGSRWGERKSIMSEPDRMSIRWTEFLTLDQIFSDRLLVDNTSEELSLQWAVFMDGLQQYCTLAENEVGRNSEEFIQEESWVLVEEDDDAWPFSFAHLCETFGLQAPSVRASLTAWKQAQMTPSSSDEAKKKTFRGLPQI
jgi:hypothetical protein